MASNKKERRPRPPKPPMDGFTAVACAWEAFNQLHPTPPADFQDYAAACRTPPDRDGNYKVYLSWERKDSDHGADTFFEVLVNGWNGQATVLLDTPLDAFRPEEFEGYPREAASYPPSSCSIETVRIGEEIWMPLEIVILEHRKRTASHRMSFRIETLKGSVQAGDRLTSSLGHDIEILGIQLGSHVWGPDICIVLADVRGEPPGPGVCLTGMGRRTAPIPRPAFFSK